LTTPYKIGYIPGIFKTPKRRCIMYVIDAEKCTGCGACAAECPAEAIEAGDVYTITDACLDCGACASECPMDAISEG